MINKKLVATAVSIFTVLTILSNTFATGEISTLKKPVPPQKFDVTIGPTLKDRPHLSALNAYESLEKSRLLDAKSNHILKSIIKPDMTQIEKAVAIHDYLVVSTIYDNSITALDEYDVIVNGQGICQSYALAYNYLLNKVGIESHYISGYAGDYPDKVKAVNHAWNLIQLDGKYYQVDVTWNDPGNTDPKVNVLSHTFFNLSDRQMNIDHLRADSVQFNATIDRVFEDNSFRPQSLEYNGNIYTTIHGNLKKYDASGKNGAVLSTENIGLFKIYNNTLYYINNSDNGSLYSMNLDGTSKTNILQKKQISSFYFYDNSIIYFSYDDFHISRFDLTSKIDKVYINEIAQNMYVYNNYIYFGNYETGVWEPRLTKVDMNGNNKKILLNYQADDFLFKNDYIYYSNKSDSNKPYRISTNGTDNFKLADDTVSYELRYDKFDFFMDWIYYYTNDGIYHRMNLDGSNNYEIKKMQSANVKFDYNYTTSGNFEVVDLNSKVNKPKDPSRTGYIFDGWYTDSSCSSAFDFNNKINFDITLYAKWNKDPNVKETYDILFYNDSNIYKKDVVNGGNLVGKPTSPSKVGYTFIGWSLTQTGTTLYNFSYPVTYNFSLYARFEKNLTVPSKFAVAKYKTGQFKASWTKVTGYTYKVYYSNSSSGQFSLVGTTTGNNLIKAGLTKGKTYYCKIRAYKTVNGVIVYSSYTISKSVKV